MDDKQPSVRTWVDDAAALIVGAAVIWGIVCAIAAPIMVWIDHVWP